MLRYFLIISLIYTFQGAFAQTSFTYDNAGNRIKRETSTVPTTNCYTFKLASNSKLLTNVNGILKVKAANSSDSQKWKLEASGSYFKVVAADNKVLGVAGGGNMDGDLITLQTNGSQDHLLWTRTPISGSNPASNVFVRKGSTLIFGSPLNWGDGDPSDLVTDIRLANDPTYTYGSAKWILDASTCPVVPGAATITTASNIYSPGAGSTFNLTSTCSGDCSGMTYTWKLGTNIVGTAANITVTAPSALGTYNYVLTATKSGISQTSTVTINVTALCYTMKLASNSKLLTNVNGILKVKAANSSDSQKWKLETSGSYVKVVAVDNKVLGVAGGGNTDGDLITLQTNGSQDHLLWTRTPISGSNPASNVFVRKGSTLIFGSPLNWGDGDPSDLVTDIRLANDPTYIYGSAKWILDGVSCPNPTGRTGVAENAVISPGNLPEVKTTLSISPNPNNGDFIISFFLESSKHASLSIINVEGKTVYQKLLTETGHYNEQVRLGSAASGIYIVQLSTIKGVETKKVSVIK